MFVRSFFIYFETLFFYCLIATTTLSLRDDNVDFRRYVRVTPTEAQDEGGSIRIQSFTHSLTEDFMGSWAPAAPTGLNSSSHYQPDGLVVWPYEGIFLGIGNVFNPFQEPGPQAMTGQVNMVLGWSADGRRCVVARMTFYFVVRRVTLTVDISVRSFLFLLYS